MDLSVNENVDALAKEVAKSIGTLQPFSRDGQISQRKSLHQQSPPSPFSQNCLFGSVRKTSTLLSKSQEISREDNSFE